MRPGDTLVPVYRPTVRRSPDRRFLAPVWKRSSDTVRRQRPRPAAAVAASTATRADGPSRAFRRDGTIKTISHDAVVVGIN